MTFRGLVTYIWPVFWLHLCFGVFISFSKNQMWSLSTQINMSPPVFCSMPESQGWRTRLPSCGTTGMITSYEVTVRGPSCLFAWLLSAKAVRAGTPPPRMSGSRTGWHQVLGKNRVLGKGVGGSLFALAHSMPGPPGKLLSYAHTPHMPADPPGMSGSCSKTYLSPHVMG